MQVTESGHCVKGEGRGGRKEGRSGPQVVRRFFFWLRPKHRLAGTRTRGRVWVREEHHASVGGGRVGEALRMRRSEKDGVNHTWVLGSMRQARPKKKSGSGRGGGGTITK